MPTVLQLPFAPGATVELCPLNSTGTTSARWVGVGFGTADAGDAVKFNAGEELVSVRVEADGPFRVELSASSATFSAKRCENRPDWAAWRDNCDSAEYWVEVQSAFVLELDDVDLEDDKAAIDERVQAAVLAALAGVFDDVEVAPTTSYEAGGRRRLGKTTAARCRALPSHLSGTLSHGSRGAPLRAA